MYGPVVVTIMIGLAVYGRILILLLQERSQRSSYHVNNEPIAHHKDDKSHRMRWALFRRSVLLYLVVSLTWILGLLAIRSNNSLLHYLFTVGCALEGIGFFFVHCYMNKDARKEATGILSIMSDKISGNSKLYNFTEEKSAAPVAKLQSAASLASVVSSDLSVNSLEMTRLSPLGASNTSISQQPGCPHPTSPSSLTISNPNSFSPSPLSSPTSQYSQVDIDDAIRRCASGSKPVKSPVSSHDLSLSPTPAAAKGAAAAATTTALRGALKKKEATSNSGSRSNSMKRRRKKSVSWKLSDNGAVDSGDETPQPTNRGGRRAMRRKQNGGMSMGNGLANGSPLAVNGHAHGHYPQKYTMKSSWTGHGKLPDIAGLSSDPSLGLAKAKTESNGVPAPQQHAPANRVKGRRLSHNGPGGLNGLSMPGRPSIGGSPATNQRRKVSPLPLSFVKRLSITSELEIPGSGLSTPAGTTTPGLYWTSRSPEPSLLENSDSSECDDHGDNSADRSESDAGNDEMSFSAASSTPLRDSIGDAVENGSSMQAWAFGKSVAERLKGDMDVDEVFKSSSDDATITTGDDDRDERVQAEWHCQIKDTEF